MKITPESRAALEARLRELGHEARRAISIALAAVLLPAGGAGQDAGIFAPAEPAAPASASANVASDGVTLRHRLVTVDIDRLAQAQAAVAGGGETSVNLRLNLFDDAVLTGIVERTTPTSSGYALSGRIEGGDGGTLTVVVNGQVVAGTIRTARGTFRIRSAGEGVHVVSEVDLSRLPPGAEPLRPPTANELAPLPRDRPAKPPADSGAGASAAPGPDRAARAGPTAPADARPTGAFIDAPRTTESTIDVAVFYTPAARQAEGGTAVIEALVDLLVAETNQAYADSGVQQRLALVLRGETQYVESASPSLDLGRLRHPADNRMDEVHLARNRFGADLVHLIGSWDTQATNTCGIANIMREVSTAFSRWAFGLTERRCGSRTFAHELGHNMGLAHDRYVECDGDRCAGAAYPYGYGYVNQRAFEAGAPESARWRTIMAYNRQCRNEGDFNCERPLRFSNPRQTYRGDPLGVPGDAASGSVTGPSDAVRALDGARSTVENFRTDAHLHAPDIAVGLSVVGDTHTTPGRAVTLSAIVRNHGTTAAPAAAVDFSHWVPTVDDFYRVFPAGSTAVGSLASGGSRTVQRQVTVPSSQGAHVYRARVDAVAGELDSSNNQSRLLRVPVIVPSCTTGLGALAGTVTRRGSWDGSCPSAYYPNGEYARYYSFRLTAPVPVTIDLTSPSADTWLALRNAFGLVAADDDGGTGTDSRISLTLPPGAYTIEATTFYGGRTGSFTLTVQADSAGTPIVFTDDPVGPGVTPIRAVHFTELRAHIDDLRRTHDLGPFAWTDPTLAAGAPVRGVHVTELRTALREAYEAAGRSPGFSTEPVLPGRPIEAGHVNELRRAVEALAWQ